MRGEQIAIPDSPSSSTKSGTKPFYWGTYACLAIVEADYHAYSKLRADL